MLETVGIIFGPFYMYLVVRLVSAAACKSYHESKQKKEKGE